MPLEDDIAAFTCWANRLNFPINDMPNDEALKAIFKSRQSLLFLNIMEKVRPRQRVKEVRQNILLYKLGKLAGQVVPAVTRGFLPKEMQLYLKIQDLRKRRSEAEASLNEIRNECNNLQGFLKAKSVQKFIDQEKHECLRMKKNLLELKRDSLEKDIENEKACKEKITLYMPVKINSVNASENKAMTAILEALKELEQFYQTPNGSNPSNRETQEELFKKLRGIFTNIPNYVLWTTILKLKEDQVQNILSMNNTSMDNKNKSLTNEGLSVLDVHIFKIQAAVISMYTKYMAAEKEQGILDSTFTSLYQQFVDTVQQTISQYGNMQQSQYQYNNDSLEDTDEIISDYIVQYNTRSFNKAQAEFLVNEIDNCKTQIEEGKKLMENHISLLGSIKQIYAETNACIQKIEQEMAQLNQIRDKILYSKNLLRYAMKEKQASQYSFTLNKIRFGSSGDSPNFSDNIFCSTKMDLDNTANVTMRSDVTIIAPTSSLPQHMLEISTFMDTPIRRLDFASKDCNRYFAPNPLLLQSNESLSTIQLGPGLLLTLEGAIQEVKKEHEWNCNLRNLASEWKIDINLTSVDQAYLKQLKVEQRGKLARLLDEIEVTGYNTNRSLKKCAKYYNFLLKNPLRHYIPDTKLFNNQTYADYEGEYQMYYRMATAGSFRS